MILEKHLEIQRLSPTEKLALVGELWDELASQPANVPVSPDQIAELDRRMAEYRRDPSKVRTWESIKQQVLGTS